MKRFLIAAGLAIAIHGLLLWTEPELLKRKFIFKPGPRAVTLTLAYYKPTRPEIALKKPVPVVKNKERKRTPVQRPQKKVIEPPKQAKTFPQPDKKNLSKQLPDTTYPSKPETHPVPKRPEIQEEPSDSLPDSKVDIFEEGASQETGEIASGTPGQVIRKARPIYRENPTPEYPMVARRRGYEGTVVLEVLVDQKGRAGELRVLTSSGYSILDKAAMRSVKDWLFEPGMTGDEKVEMWVRIPIRFELE